MVEAVLVGVFGAFIGGEFLADMLGGAVTAANPGFGFGARIMLAAASAAALVGLLAAMRKAVGPMRGGKPKPNRR
jgi:hypothetical protein